MWFGVYVGVGVREGFDYRRPSNGDAEGGRIWEGGIPSLVGVGSGRAMPPPQKIFVFSPSKWCIFMHSGARFRPTVIATMMCMT